MRLPGNDESATGLGKVEGGAAMVGWGSRLPSPRFPLAHESRTQHLITPTPSPGIHGKGLPHAVHVRGLRLLKGGADGCAYPGMTKVRQD